MQKRVANNSDKNEIKAPIKYYTQYAEETFEDKLFSRPEYGWYCSKCACGWISRKEFKLPPVLARHFNQEIRLIKPSCPNCGGTRNVSMNDAVQDEILMRRHKVASDIKKNESKFIIFVLVLLLIIFALALNNAR